MNNKKLVLIELNEINFDFVKKYITKYSLPNFERICNEGIKETSSEEKYEELEPWIQWVSAHTGKAFDEHGVFRLGDIVTHNQNQIFEEVESMGYSVGAISPMNAANNLKQPYYFIPDPWTLTSSDNSFWSKKLTKVIQQVVNDNAQSKISLNSLFFLGLGLIRFARVKNYAKYLTLVLSSVKKCWSKAMILDLLLHDIHWTLLKKQKPNFSTLFINAGAHLQHHYMFNSEVYNDKEAIKNPSWYINQDSDPLLELLTLYDNILGDYLASDYDVLIATGLTQIPFTHEKYYWRIKNHQEFLTKLDIKFKLVAPRMTRDFLIEFDTEKDASIAEEKLKNIVSVADNIPLFKEIDNRKTSLFVTLTYPREVKSTFEISHNSAVYDIADDLAFVAIKNGMHSQRGFVYGKGIDIEDLNSKPHVKNIFGCIKNYFSS